MYYIQNVIQAFGANHWRHDSPPGLVCREGRDLLTTEYSAHLRSGEEKLVSGVRRLGGEGEGEGRRLYFFGGANKRLANMI